MEISKEDFEKYEMVRKSGVTNMFDIQRVKTYSGLSYDKVKFIMKNYSELRNKFGL